MAAGNNNTGRRTGLPPVLFKVVLPLLLVLLLAGFYLSGQGTDGSEGTDITLRSDIKGEFSLDDMRKAVKEKQPSRSEEELSPDGGTGTDLEQLRDLIRENEGSFRSEETDTPVPVTAPPAVPVQHPVVAAAVAAVPAVGTVQPAADSVPVQPEPPKRRGFNNIRLVKEEERNVIRAFVHSTQTVTVGSTLKMQIAENCLTDDGRRIRKGTPVYGEVTAINGERVQVRITSVNLDGNILAFHKGVYSEDAIEGIYVPGNPKAEGSQKAGAAAVQGADAHVSGGFGVGSQLIAGAANSVVSAAKSVAGKNIKQVKVTIKTNYRILLKTDKKK